MASITIQSDKLSIRFEATDVGLEVSENGTRAVTSSNCLSASTNDVHLHEWWTVVGAKVEKDSLRVDIVVEKKSGSSVLVTHRGHYIGDENTARNWAQRVQSFAYPGESHNAQKKPLTQTLQIDSKPGRKLKIFVNPFGGKGKGLKTFSEKVKPILDAGQCICDVTCKGTYKYACRR